MRRGAVIGIVGAVALVAAGGLAAWLMTRPPSAEDTANAYLRALAAGDFDAVQALLADPRPAAIELLENTFTGAESYIGDYDFTIASDSSVRAETELAGESAVVFFGLVDTSEGWRVGSDYLASLTAATSIGDSVHVGDALVPAGTRIAVLPAQYRVSAAPSGLLDGDTVISVTNDAAVDVEVAASVSPDALPAVQEQVDVYAEGCAQSATTVPENCGIRVPWTVDLATLDAIAFRIDASPSVTLADDGHSFDATAGVIVATASGTTRDGESASFTYRADDWALRGDVSYTGDEMVLAVH